MGKTPHTNSPIEILLVAVLFFFFENVCVRFLRQGVFCLDTVKHFAVITDFAFYFVPWIWWDSSAIRIFWACRINAVSDMTVDWSLQPFLSVARAYADTRMECTKICSKRRKCSFIFKFICYEWFCIMHELSLSLCSKYLSRHLTQFYLRIYCRHKECSRKKRPLQSKCTHSFSKRMNYGHEA